MRVESECNCASIVIEKRLAAAAASRERALIALTGARMRAHTSPYIALASVTSAVVFVSRT